jgi:hypothetical protein
MTGRSLTGVPINFPGEKTMKAPSGIAMLPDGSEYSGYILLRHRGTTTTVWGFGVPKSRTDFDMMALPAGTVLVEFPKDTPFFVPPTRLESLHRARMGMEGYREVIQDITAPLPVQPAIMPGHYGPVPTFA